MSNFAANTSGRNGRWQDDVLDARSFSHGDPPDFCSQSGALALKARIEAYWRERGHNVMLSLHNVGFHPAIRAARYDVRSDMINGMPRSYAKVINEAGANGAGTGRAPSEPDDDFADEIDDDCDEYGAEGR